MRDDACHEKVLLEDEVLQIEGAYYCPRCLAPLRPFEPPPLRVYREYREEFHRQCTVMHGTGQQCRCVAISDNPLRCRRHASRGDRDHGVLHVDDPS
jgi:hypothetical protein